MKKIIIAAGLLLLPRLASATTDCWYKDYPDHYEAICIGDEKALLEKNHSGNGGKGQSAVQAAPSTGKTIQNGLAGSLYSLTNGGPATPQAAAPATGTKAAQGTSTAAEQQKPPAATGQTRAISAQALYGPRPGRMSKARVDAAIAARNKLLQSQ